MKYIGIDFGDGTTAASLFDDTLAEEARVPRPQDIVNQGGSGDRAEVPSFLAYPVKDGELDPSRTFLVGTRAAEAEQGDWDVRSNWKHRPTEPDEVPGYPVEARVEDAKHFMARIWSLFKETNRSLGLDDVRVVIGAPSGWTEADRVMFGAWAREAGLPNVRVVSESTAAFLYSRKFLRTADGQHLPDEALERGLLLIDIGSSTTDFTYAKGLDAPKKFGFPLGAKAVDEAVLRYNLSRDPSRAKALHKIVFSKDNGEFRSRLLFLCRALKEKYFTKADGATGAVVVSDRKELPVGDDWLDLYIFDRKSPARAVAPDFWDSILESGCAEDFRVALPGGARIAWREAFRQGLAYVRDNLVGKAGCKGLTIVLTGGASRMTFVEDDIRTVFGSGVVILAGSGADRSFSVANGLAWAGYAQEKISAAEKALPAEIDKFLASAEATKIFSDNLVSPAAREAVKALKSELPKSLKGAPTRFNTKRKIDAEAKRIAKASLGKVLEKEALRNRIAATAAKLLAMPAMTKATDALVREFGRTKLFSANEDIKVGDVEVSPDFTVPLDIDGIAGSVIGGLGGLAALIFTGPIGWVLAPVVFVLARIIMSRGPDDPLDADKVRELAAQIPSADFSKVESSIAEALMGKKSKTSYRNACEGEIKNIVVGMKRAELNALAGRFNDK